jgi:hypothetical protein
MSTYEYWADVTETYKVTSSVALDDEQLRSLLEAYNEGEPNALSRVSLKGTSIEIDSVKDGDE